MCLVSTGAGASSICNSSPRPSPDADIKYF